MSNLVHQLIALASYIAQGAPALNHLSVSEAGRVLILSISNCCPWLAGAYKQNQWLWAGAAD